MVAVATDHRHEILLYPFVEEFRVTVVLLGYGPCVRELVHHQEAHPVAEVQELGRRGIVRGADGVTAHFLEHLEAADPGVVVPDRTEGARVMVQAHAFQEGLFAVEVESVGLPFGLADAEVRLVLVQHLVGGFHGGAGDVHLRGFRAPEAGARHFEGLDDGLSVLDVLDAAGFGKDSVDRDCLAVLEVGERVDNLRPDHADGLLARMFEGDPQGDVGVGVGPRFSARGKSSELFDGVEVELAWLF